MKEIILYCECCKKTWVLEKTPELPAHVFNLRCNYCIDCDVAGRMQDYYQEWWEDEDNTEDGPLLPVPDNQLCLPFIFDEIGITQIEKIVQE